MNELHMLARFFPVYGEDFRFGELIMKAAAKKVGKHVAIDHGFYCTVPITLGDHVHIGPYVSVIGGKNASFEMKHFSNIAAGGRVICCGDELMGAGIVNPTIPPKYRDKLINKPVVLEEFTVLGTNSVIVPGVKLAIGSVVGANSLVLHDTEPWGVYVGNPVKLLKIRPKETLLAYAKEMGYSEIVG